MIANQREELESSGELKADLFEDDAKLFSSISRIGARLRGEACDRCRAGGCRGGAARRFPTLRRERHTGLVVCQKGMAVFEGVVRELLQETTDPAEVE